MASDDLARLLDALYDAALEPERWEDWLGRFSALNRDAAVYLGQSSLADFGHGDIWTHRLDRGGWDAVDASTRAVGDGEAVTRAVAMPLLRVFDRAELMPDDRARDDPAFAAFLVANGLRHAKLCKVHADAETASMFWMARPRGRDFSLGETERFGTLAGHLGRAMRLHRRLSRERSRADALGRTLDRFTSGVLLVDRDLRVLYANPAAEAVLEDGAGLRRVGRHLMCRRTAALEELRRAARRVSSGAFEAHVVVPRDAHEAPIGLRLLALRGEAASRLAPRGEIAIFLLDPCATLPEPSLSMLGLVYELTAAEARIAVLSARAMRPTEIAATLGLSENTVKTHLKTVFRKLGSRSQADLVRLVLRLAPPA